MKNKVSIKIQSSLIPTQQDLEIAKANLSKIAQNLPYDKNDFGFGLKKIC